MEIAGTPLHAAATAPMVNRPLERAHGSSVPRPSSTVEADSQDSGVYLSPRTAALWVVLRVVEQFRTVSQLGQGAEDTATIGLDIGRKPASAITVESSLDLYA